LEGVYSFVLIASDSGTANGTLDLHVNDVLQQNVSEYFYLDRTSAWLDDYTAVRFVVESKTDRTVRGYQYILQDNQKDFWVITYIAPMATFADHIADFELSAMTFHASPSLAPPTATP
jgi:hypothetical protein